MSKPQPKEQPKITWDQVDWSSTDPSTQPGAKEVAFATNVTQVPKVLSHPQLAEIEDKGVDPWKAWQPGYNVPAELAARQSKGEATWRAIEGGVGKGLYTFLEDIGYLGDIQEWMGASDDMDHGETNWLSDWAKDQKSEYDAWNPVYSEKSNDFGWWMQNMQGLIDSAVGFGLTGGAGGAVVKGALKGTKYLMGLNKLGFATEQFATRLGTAAMTNYAESKMMAGELWNNVYNKAIAEGINHDEATQMASSEASDFIWKNKANIATDYVALRHIVNGRSVIAGNAERTFKQKALGVAKDMAGEAYEEMYSGFQQKESERSAYEQLGLQKPTDDSYFGRAVDYATSDEGFREGLLGAIGGPVQTGAVTGVSKITDYVTDKFGIQKNVPQPPAPFEAAEPTPPGDLPQDPGPAPQTPEEYYKARYPKWTETQIKERAKLDKNVQFKYAEQKKDYDVKKEVYDKALEQHVEYKNQLEAYNKAKQDHINAQANYEKEAAEYQLNKNTGKRAQAQKDINTFLSSEQELQEQYQKALLEGDHPKMTDIENQRFEGLYMRYAKRGSVDALEMQLGEIISNPNSTPEEREKAQKYLNQMPVYQKEYLKAFNQHAESGLTEPVFRTRMRMINSQETIGNINKEIAETKNDLATTVANVEGTSVSPTEQEYLSLRAEQRELKNLEEGLKDKYNPKLASEFNRKIEEYETRMEALKKELDSNAESHFFVRDEVKQSVLKNFSEFKQLETLAKNKANAWAAYKAYENAYNYMSGTKFTKDVADTNHAYIANQLNKAVSTKDVEVITRQLNTLNMSKRQRADLEAQLVKKAAVIANDEKSLLQEYERKRTAYKDLREQHQQLITDLRDTYGSLEASQERVRMAEYSGDESEVNKALVERNRLRNKVRTMKENQSHIEDLMTLPAYDTSSYDGLPTMDDFKFDPETTVKPVDTAPGYDNRTTVIDDHGPEPGEERDLTASEIARAEDALKKKASKTNKAGLEDKAENARVARTQKAIVTSDVKDETIFTQSSELPVITPEAQAKQKYILDEFEFSIAYVSQTDKRGEHDLALTDWLETTTHTDKVGTKLRFEVSHHDKKYANDAYDAFKAGETLSDEQVLNLPIRIVAYNEQGQPLKFGGKEVFGWMRTGSYDFKDNAAQKRANLLSARKKIADALQKGGNLEATITEVGKGMLQTDTVEKDPRKFMKNIEIVMSDGHTGLVKGKYRKERQIDKRFEKTETEAGFPFLVTQMSNGTYFPLRLNSRRLNATEAGVVYKIFYAYANGFSPSQKIENIPEITGLTYQQAIDLLVYEGKQSLDKKYPLYADLKAKTIQFGNKTVSFQDFSGAQTEFMTYVQQLVRTTDSSMINKALNSKIADDFNWFGATIDIDTNYNDFLMNDGVLTTNATFPGDRAFINPYVKISSPSSWQPIGVKMEEMPTQKSSAKPAKAIEEGDIKFKIISPVDNSKVGEEIDPLFGPLKKEFDYSPEENFVDDSADVMSTEAVDMTSKAPEVANPLPPKAAESDDLSDIDGWETLPDNDNLFGEDFGPLKSTFEGRTQKVDVNKELAELKRLLPNVPSQVYNGLLRINGGFAEGMFYKGVITLSDTGNKGVAYHEAFHAVSQLYLSPEARQELYTEAKKRFGKNLTDLEVEELMAEEFREYMINRGELKVPSTFKWLYNLLMDLVNVFKTKKGKLFANIRAGRFDYTAPFDSSQTLTSRLPFSMDFVKTAIDVATFATVKESGILSLDRDSSDFGNLEETFDRVKLRFQTWAKQCKDAGDLEKAKNFRDVVLYWDQIKALVKDEIIAYNLSEKKDDEDTSEESGFVGDQEVATEGYKNEGLNIKTALSFSGKDNATGNTKLLVSLLPTSERDPFFNLPRFSNFAKTWRLLEDNLSGIVDANVMVAKIEALSESHPYLKPLVDSMKSTTFPEFKKIQFLNAFSKQSVLYSNTIGKEIEEGKYEWIVGNADTQNQATRLRDNWKEAFTVDYVDANQKLKDVDLLRKAVANFKAFSDRVKKQDFPLEAAYEHWSMLLNGIGVQTSPRGLKSFVSFQQGSSEYFKFNNAVNKLYPAIVAVRDNISLEKMLAPEYKWDDEKNFISDNSIFQQLGKTEAQFSKIPGENSVLGPDGNTYWTKSLNNFMTKMTSAWKANRSLISHMRQKSYHKDSMWLRLLATDDAVFEDFRIEVFLSNRVEDAGDQGTSYTDLTNPDEMVDRIVRTLSGVTNKNGLGSTFSPLTFADKSSWYQISGIPVGKYSVKHSDEGWEISKRTVNTIYNYILSELERIGYAIDNPNEVQYFEDYSKQLFWFPELNNGTTLAKEIGLYDSKGKPVVTNDLKNKLRPYIESILSKRFDATKKKLQELGILSEQSTVMHGISQSIISHYKRENEIKGQEYTLESRANHELIADYVLNSIVANIEFTMMFTGDPAFYKDLAKRTAEAIATGQDLISLNDNIRPNFNIAIANDIEGEAPMYNDYLSAYKAAGVKNAETILKPYKGNNQADAQAYIRPSRFREIMVGLGKWEPKFEAAFNKLMSGEKVSAKDLRAMAPLKGMHFELRELDNVLVPTYLKYSQAVLWPSLVKGTRLERVLNKMEKEGIDELIYNSGVKVGAEGAIDITPVMDGKDDVKFHKISLSNFNWKLQNDLPNKYEKSGEALVGSQVRKNILMNLSGKTIIVDGQEKTGAEVAELIHYTESRLSNLGKKSITKKWGIKDNKITDWGSVYKSLEHKFKRDRVNSNIIEQIQKGMPFDAIFQFKEKIEQELHALINKKTVKLKAPGGAFIQVSNAGFDRVTSSQDVDPNGIIWFIGQEELKGPRMIDGVVKSAQVLLPYKVVRLIPGHENMTATEIRKHISDDVLQGIIGYRIPNQGMSSIDSLEIAGILPPSVGDTIVTYTEVTGKTGSDFDIDKMFVMMPHNRFNKETGKVERIPSNGDTKESLENRRIELWNAILTSPDTFVELTSPLDSGWLKEDAYYIALINESRTNPAIWENVGMSREDFLKAPNRKKLATDFFKNRKPAGLEFASPEFQFETKTRNIAGKAGVGQTANHLVHHVISQAAKLSFSFDFLKGLVKSKALEDGTQVVDLSAERNIKGEYITQIISAWLNAYVDNAKDPYISLINNNTYTANTVFMLLRSGADPEWVNRFMTQPILQDLAKEQANAKSKILPLDFKHYKKLSITADGGVTKTNVKNSPIDFITKVARKWNPNDELLENVPVIFPDELKDKLLDKDFLEEQILNPDPLFQSAILTKFMELNWAATKLNDAVRASKQDTVGATSSAAENLAARELYEKVVNDGVIYNFENLFKNTMLGTFKENSQDFSDDVFKTSLFSKNKGVENIVKAISAKLKRSYATDSTLNKKIIGDMYTYMYSGFHIFKASPEKIDGLFRGKKSLARKVAHMKQMEMFKDNILLQALGTKLNPDLEGLSFVTMASSKHKDRTEADTLWIRWEQMLSDDTEIVDGYTVKDFAEELVLYAFQASGFKKNINSFFDLIPNSYLNGELAGTRTHEIPFSGYVRDITQNQHVDYSKFIDQFFRHNWDNEDIVPKVSLKMVQKLTHGKQVIPFSEGIGISAEDFPNRLNTSMVPNEVVPMDYIKVKVKKDMYLYRKVGYKEGVYVYESVEPLGIKEKGNVISEYGFDELKRSAVNDLAPGLRTEFKETLDEYAFEDFILDNPDTTFNFNDPTISQTATGTRIDFAGVPGVHFRMEQTNHPVTGDVLFNLVAVREKDGREFNVHDFASLEEDAANAGIEHLRHMSIRLFEQGLKTEC